jgi:hypothetical protein
MLRAEVVRRIGSQDTTVGISEDYEYWLRAAHEFVFGFQEAVTASYRVHPGGVSADTVREAYKAHRALFLALARVGTPWPKRALLLAVSAVRVLSVASQNASVNDAEFADLVDAVGAPGALRSWRPVFKQTGKLRDPVRRLLQRPQDYP